MEKRKILVSKVEKEVSLLGFGCMRFPMKDGEVDVQEAKKMIDYAVSKGVNYIDTAYPYHGGKSELIVRDIIKDYDREKFYLADKLPIWEVKSVEDVSRLFHEQLEKTGVDYFDFYLVHAVNRGHIQTLTDFKILEELERFRSEGKIRNIGFSFHDDLEAFKLWVEIYDWDFVQIQLNYMDTEHQQGITGYEILTEKGIPVIIMEPVKGGSLVKYNERIEKLFTDYNPDDSIASWGFRWVGSLPNVKVILSGMSTFEQVEDNIKTFSQFKPLNETELNIINQVKKQVLALSKVDCTSCNYCMPCPHGVNIPANFRIFNSHSMYQQDGHTKWAYGNLEKSLASADLCIECGECLSKCPQFIEIPTQLSNFVEYLKDNGLTE